MRKWLGLFILVCFSCQNKQSERFQISGFVEGATDRALLVKKFDGDGYQTIDSVRIRNGVFDYSGKVVYPELYRFYLAGSDEYFPVFIENSKIRINTSIKNFSSATVQGSQSHNLYQLFTRTVDSLNQLAVPLISQLKTSIDEAQKKVLKQQLADLSSKQLNFVKEFVTNHPHSVVSLYILYKYLSGELSVEEYERLYRQMDTTILNSPYAGYIEHQIDIMRHTRVGQKAYNIVLPDTSGTSISLYSISNQFILLHFWASWCDACRNEIPDLVGYAKNKNQLTIVSISLDTHYKRWTMAIKQFQMPWIHLSDLKGWKNYAAKTFGVRAIPFYILTDNNYTILYRGSQLNEIKKIVDSSK